FEIVYKEDAVLAFDDATKSEFEVYRTNGDYIIKSSKQLGKIEVYDSSGRLMMTANTKEKILKLDTSVLVNGVYIIKAENSGDIRTKKIIK
ncbi:MAG: T9SS type A sorting domain-containing protein, partial [Chryseobacterium sp.]|nr:T9SS type A sorting domain-containing protein [Chryseobacterium sp.]